MTDVINYILQRYSDNRDDTLGLMFKISLGKPLFQAYTLEDQYQAVKVKKETRVPAMKYEIVIQMAETPKTLAYRQRYSWFKHHLMLLNVPGFQGVYIHIGNDDEDTEACILVGDHANNNRIGSGQITNSTDAFIRLYSELYDHLAEGGKAYIDIRDEVKLL